MKHYASYMATGSQWLDSIPAHWKLGRLDHVARAWPSNVDKHSVEGELPVRLCNYTDVYKNDAIVAELPFMTATASAEQVERFRVRIGDTVITKDSETADDIGIPAFVNYEADDLVCGYHLSIVRPDPAEVWPKYLFWALRAQPTLGQWEVLASGVTRVGLRSGDVSRAALALPPLDEQRAIADYLDLETDRLDTLIEQQQRLIEMLRERRRAAVEFTLTRTHTEAVGQRLKHVVLEVRQGWSPQCYPQAGDGITTWCVLKAGAVNGGVFRAGENKELPETENPRADAVVRPGELVISRANTRELAGSAAVVDGEYPRLMLSDKLYGFMLDPDRALPIYVAAVLGTHRWRGLIELEATGTSPSMQNISQADILNLPMDLPSIDEQRRIAAYLNEQTAKIDILITETETFIDLARERRSALITAAVTGQVDVRDAA